MRIAMVVKPFTDANLRLAAQIGVTDVVIRYPGPRPEDLAPVQKQVEAAGMKVSVIEGYLPMERTVLGQPGRDEEIEEVSTLLRTMGQSGVEVLCYNWMSILDATRTSFALADRGGALVSGFDVDELAGDDLATSTTVARSEEQFWDSLAYFLRRVLPVAEEAGVKLAMHPDDPPGLERLHGQPRMMGRVDQFERLTRLVPSEANGVCFCQGCFAEMGVDVPAAIRRLGPSIHYVHFRDVVGCTPRFRETFHDCGQTDMAVAMRVYRDIGYSGVMRPDHVPLLEGETVPADGYSMLGRLFAVGYMRGLMQAVASEPRVP